MTSQVNRSKNFKEEEKAYLAEIINANPIIESKSYESFVIKRKIEAWVLIHDTFNSKYPGTDMDSLKRLWKRLKEKAKKEHDGSKREQRKTGGGTSEASISSVSQIVAGVMGDTLDPLPNEFDDDHEDIENLEPPPIKQQKLNTPRTTTKTSCEFKISINSFIKFSFYYKER